MSAPMFSLLHATFGRPAKAIAAMHMALERADNPDAVGYIFAVNNDDPSWSDFRAALILSEERATLLSGGYAGSAPAWDAAAKISTGQILIQMQDDLVLPPHWDGMLVEELEGANVDRNHWRTVPTVVRVRDGYRRDALLCTAIMNRARYEQQGEFLHAGYQSVFSDDEHSLRAYADEADGKCQVIRTDIEFRHENPYHTGAPHDATLRRENSPEAYALGGKLFMERNAALVARGFKTW